MLEGRGIWGLRKVEVVRVTVCVCGERRRSVGNGPTLLSKASFVLWSMAYCHKNVLRYLCHQNYYKKRLFDFVYLQAFSF